MDYNFSKDLLLIREILEDYFTKKETEEIKLIELDRMYESSK